MTDAEKRARAHINFIKETDGDDILQKVHHILDREHPQTGLSSANCNERRIDRRGDSVRANAIMHLENYFTRRGSQIIHRSEILNSLAYTNDSHMYSDLRALIAKGVIVMVRRGYYMLVKRNEGEAA